MNSKGRSIGARNVKCHQAKDLKRKHAKSQQKTSPPNTAKKPLNTTGNNAVSKQRNDEDRILLQEKDDDRILFNKKHSEGLIPPKQQIAESDDEDLNRSSKNESEDRIQSDSKKQVRSEEV